MIESAREIDLSPQYPRPLFLYALFYGGMTYTTTCCVNRKHYRPGIDAPCNGAAAPSAALAALLAVGAASCWLWR